MHVEINDKAKADRKLTGVSFIVSCVDGPKESNASGRCPYLELALASSGEVIKPGGKAFVSLVVGVNQSEVIVWLFQAPDCENAAQKKIQPVTVPCNQDKNWALSGDVSIELNAKTSYSGIRKEEICDKKTGTFVNVFTGEQILHFATGEPFPCTV